MEGRFAGHPLQATLQPDGQGGHWLQVEEALRAAAAVEVGTTVTLEIAPAAVEPEPVLPDDLARALAAHPPARAAWDTLTTVARRDWIFWIGAGKQAQTRVKRIASTCDMLAAGKRRGKALGLLLRPLGHVQQGLRRAAGAMRSWRARPAWPPSRQDPRKRLPILRDVHP